MKKDLITNVEFIDAIKNKELVYIFCTGISSALTGQRYSWWKWICDGIDGLKKAKLDNTYNTWMETSFESNKLENKQLVETLCKLLITQDVFATTNYDLLLEQATGLHTATYDQPEVIFPMLDSRVSKYVLHLHSWGL